MSKYASKPAATRRRALEVVRETRSLVRAARAVGVCFRTAQRWATEAGIELGPVVARTITPEEEAALEEIRQGSPVTAAARRHGLPGGPKYRRLYRLAQALGIDYGRARKERACPQGLPSASP